MFDEYQNALFKIECTRLEFQGRVGAPRQELVDSTGISILNY